MAYFAQIDDLNIVQQVIAVNHNEVDNLPFPASEPIGQEFIASLGIEGTWIQTSYSGNYRGVYAGIEMTFNPTLGEYGEFVPLPPGPPIETPSS